MLNTLRRVTSEGTSKIFKFSDLTWKVLLLASECSRIFIFKISIGRRTFLRNRKKTAILNRKDENQNNDRNCEEQLYQRQKITKPLIVAITHDKNRSDRYLWRRRLQWGEEKYHGTLPGHEI